MMQEEGHLEGMMRHEIHKWITDMRRINKWDKVMLGLIQLSYALMHQAQYSKGVIIQGSMESVLFIACKHMFDVAASMLVEQPAFWLDCEPKLFLDAVEERSFEEIRPLIERAMR